MWNTQLHARKSLKVMVIGGAADGKFKIVTGCSLLETIALKHGEGTEFLEAKA